jgi:hypothetical protein
MDESSVKHNRRSRRSPVLLSASIEFDGAVHDVKLRNLSPEGALVEGADAIPEQSDIVFHRNDLCVAARVAWIQGKYAGIAFNHRLEPGEVLRHVSRRVAKPVPPQLFARPALTRHALSPSERRWIADWMDSSAMNKPGE